jgi:hypothetical protein
MNFVGDEISHEHHLLVQALEPVAFPTAPVQEITNTIISAKMHHKSVASFDVDVSFITPMRADNDPARAVGPAIDALKTFPEVFRYPQFGMKCAASRTNCIFRVLLFSAISLSWPKMHQDTVGDSKPGHALFAEPALRTQFNKPWNPESLRGFADYQLETSDHAIRDPECSFHGCQSVTYVSHLEMDVCGIVSAQANSPITARVRAARGMIRCGPFAAQNHDMAHLAPVNQPQPRPAALMALHRSPAASVPCGLPPFPRLVS